MWSGHDKDKSVSSIGNVNDVTEKVKDDKGITTSNNQNIITNNARPQESVSIVITNIPAVDERDEILKEQKFVTLWMLDVQCWILNIDFSTAGPGSRGSLSLCQRAGRCLRWNCHRSGQR